MMTMKEKLQIHREIERQDREHRLWHRNNEVLNRLLGDFPVGATVENFGVRATVDGYQVRNLAYTGDLILRDLETGQRWIAKTDLCKAIA